MIASVEQILKSQDNMIKISRNKTEIFEKYMYFPKENRNVH